MSEATRPCLRAEHPGNQSKQIEQIPGDGVARLAIAMHHVPAVALAAHDAERLAPRDRKRPFAGAPPHGLERAHRRRYVAAYLDPNVESRRDERQMQSLLDLRAVAARHGLEPGEIAHHLDENGLGRAARYTLTLARDHAGDEFAAAVLERLRPDPLGEKLARAALAAVRGAEQPSLVAAIPAAFLDRSLIDSVLALGAHASGAARREAKRLLRR